MCYNFNNRRNRGIFQPRPVFDVFFVEHNINKHNTLLYKMDSNVNAETLDINQLLVERLKLTTPPLEEIIQAILPELSKIFQTVSVEVAECPDLTRPPYYLAAEGLCGDATAIHFGSLSYLMPLANMEKLYDMRDIQKITESAPLFVIGAGVGPWPHTGNCSEFIGNVHLTCNNRINNRSHVYKVDNETDSILHDQLPQNETRFAHMANLFTSNGFKGMVLKIVCETRIGSSEFVTSIREALKKYFGDKTICLGGVMLIENGKVKVHFCPYYPKTPLDSDSKIKKWLKCYEVPTPLVGVGYIASHDAGMDMFPLQHFHVFSDHGAGGHYLHDTEPTTVKYTAYFNVAENFVRVDRPEVPFSLQK